MARTATANDILNDTAVEVGIAPVNDPASSSDEAFVQLLGLLNSVGRELVTLDDWQILIRNFSITTNSGDSGTYPLPDDYDRMLNQTGWDRTNRVAVWGPLSPQDWTYLEGRDLISQSIYASYRILGEKLELYPQPPPDNLTITFEYISLNWVQAQGQAMGNKDSVELGSDFVVFDKNLVIKFLKCKFLEAKGFDATAARLEFDTLLGNKKGQDTGAPVLNASGSRRSYPYLSPVYNLGDSGYGH